MICLKVKSLDLINWEELWLTDGFPEQCNIIRIGSNLSVKSKLSQKSKSLLRKRRPEKSSTRFKKNIDFMYYFILVLNSFLNLKNKFLFDDKIRILDFHIWKVNLEKNVKLYQIFHLTIPPRPPCFILLLNLCIVSVSLLVFRDWYIALSILTISYCYVFILFYLSLKRINIIFRPFQDFCFNWFR